MDPATIAKIEQRLLNKAVSIWLSPEGKSALGHIVEKDSFRTLVESVDALGLWLRLPPRPGSSSSQSDSVLLLKWNYLASAQVPAEPGGLQQTVKPEFIH